jgi:hypothetical protein
MMQEPTQRTIGLEDLQPITSVSVTAQLGRHDQQSVASSMGTERVVQDVAPMVCGHYAMAST